MWVDPVMIKAPIDIWLSRIQAGHLFWFKFETKVQNLGLLLFLDDNLRTPCQIDLKFGMWVDHVVIKKAGNV